MESPEGDIKRIVVERMDRCRVCHRTYGTDDVRVISRDSEMWMMVVECTDCHAKNFVAAVLNEGDPAQAEIALKRLSETQVQQRQDLPWSSQKIETGPRVEAGDVADMHAFLSGFEGDFKRLFGDRK